MFVRSNALLLAVVLVSGCASSAPETQKPYKPIILDASEGEMISFPAHATRRLSSVDSSQAGLSLFEIVIPPNSGGAPPHTHMHEDEFFYVRSGEPTFMANGRRKTVAPGGFTLLPRNSMHAVWNDGEVEAVLLVGTSRGRFDDFFDVVALEVRESGAKTPAEIGRIMGQIGIARGIEIHMDKLPTDVATLYGLSAN